MTKLLMLSAPSISPNSNLNSLSLPILGLVIVSLFPVLGFLRVGGLGSFLPAVGSWFGVDYPGALLSARIPKPNTSWLSAAVFLSNSLGNFRPVGDVYG